MRRYGPIILFLFTFVNTAYPQNEKTLWSLQDCIQYAMRNNLDLQDQSLNLQQLEINLKQSRNDLYPDLNFGAGRTWSFGDKFDVYTNTYQQNQSMNDNYALSTSVMLFSGFQKLKTIKRNKLTLMANREYYNKSKDDLKMNIATAYLNILFAKERYHALKMQYSISKLQIEKTKKLVAAGSLPEGNLLDVQAQASSDELNMVNAKNNLDLAILTLTQILDLPTAENFDIKEPALDIKDFSLPAENVQAILNIALRERPELKAAEWEKQASMENLHIARAGRYPTISLNGSLTSRYSTSVKLIDPATIHPEGTQATPYFTQSGEAVFQNKIGYDTYIKPYRDQLKDGFYQYISLNLNIPLFNNFRVRNAIQREKINVDKANIKQQKISHEIYKIIQQAYLDAKAAAAKYEATSKKQAAAQKAFEYTQKKFEIGMLNSVDFQLSKSNLTLAESENIQAKYEYIFKILILNFYMGKELSL